MIRTTATRRGACKVCGTTIRPGTEILYRKFVGSSCLGCAAGLRSLPAHKPPPAETRVCRSCGAEKAIRWFRAYGRGGEAYSPICSSCRWARDKRWHEGEAEREAAERQARIDQEFIDRAPDPTPAILLVQKLRALRSEGFEFEEAFPMAREGVWADCSLPLDEQRDWDEVFVWGMANFWGAFYGRDPREAPRLRVVDEVRRPASKERVQARRERVAELWAEGWNSDEIAAELHVTRGTVEQDVRKLRLAGRDLPPRPRGPRTQNRPVSRSAA